jgi:hypothetical protein
MTSPVNPCVGAFLLATIGPDSPDSALIIANDKPHNTPTLSVCNQTALDAPFVFCISSAYPNILSGYKFTDNGKVAQCSKSQIFFNQHNT